MTRREMDEAVGLEPADHTSNPPQIERRPGAARIIEINVDQPGPGQDIGGRQASRVRRPIGQQADLGLRIGFANKMQAWQRDDEIADAA